MPIRLALFLFICALCSAVSVATAKAEDTVSEKPQDQDTLVIGLPDGLRQPLSEALVLPYQRGWSDAYRGRVARRQNGSATPDIPQRKVKIIAFSGQLPTKADVVFMPAETLAAACANGNLAPIDWPHIGNASLYLDAAVTKCGVGAAVWATVIAYDPAVLSDAPEKTGRPPSSWKDFFDTRLLKGARGLPDHARDTLEIALLADGVALDQIYDQLATKAGVDRAFAKLDSLAKDIVWWQNPADAAKLLKTGKVVLVAAPSMDILNANATDATGHVLVWPPSFYQVDAWSIPADTAHPADAMKWIAFAAQPENQITMPSAIRAGITQREAFDQVQPAFARDTPTAPGQFEQLLPSDADFWFSSGPALEARFRAWRNAQKP